MAQTAGLIFTNDSGAGSGTSTYVQDTLPDYTFPPSNNAGFSSTVSNNPLGNSYANTDLPQYGAKYLPIKDLILLQDRSKWIDNKSTYQVIFYENFPQVQAYIFGDIQVSYNSGQVSVLIRGAGDGISVNGVIRQVAFLVQPIVGGSGSGQVVVDGVNGNTINFSGYPSGIYGANGSFPGLSNSFNAFIHKSTMESYGIHDIRLTSQNQQTMNIGGIIVYFENSGKNLDQFPGTTYVNKTKVATASGSTFSIPSMGSSLGGNFSIYKTSVAGYTTSALSATTIASTASGSSGTNLLNLAAGTGASFLAGYGVIVTQGSSTYIGSIASISTDTVTMGNTLGFGITAGAPIYTAWKCGQSIAINASLMSLYASIDFSRMYANGSSAVGVSLAIFDPKGNYALWGKNIQVSPTNTNVDGDMAAVFSGSSGFIQVDGYFSAAEIELIGAANTFSATFCVNGLPCFGASIVVNNAGNRVTVFSDAGPGWNSFSIPASPSSLSAGTLGLQRINLYQRSRDFSVSYGVLADFDIAQTYTNRDSINATMMALGPIRRVYADQLGFKNTWIRGQTMTVPGGAYFQGASTNGSLSFQYYGTHFAIIGTVNTGSTLTLDNTGIGLTFNVMQTVATLGFHTISYTGGTAQISAIDYLSPIFKWATDARQASGILSLGPVYQAPTMVVLPAGSGTYTGPKNKQPLYLKAKIYGAGGGGAGSGTASQGTGGTGGDTSFGTTLLIAGGGGGGIGGVNGGIGGSYFIGYGAIGFGINGGTGQGPTQTTAAVQTIFTSGGMGAASPLGGAGSGDDQSSGTDAAPNSGSGGGGAGLSTTASGIDGGGGGAGAFVEAIIPITSPTISFPFVIGQRGAAGNAGTNGFTGGFGGGGLIVIEEYYQ